MALDAETLRNSFEIIASREANITTRFYEILFARYPQVQPLFSRNASERQARMLQEALVAVIDHVDDAAWLGQTLHGLGVKHVDYGVTAEMYPWVGECLLATLAEIAADQWSPKVERAWAEAYGAISGLMLAGSRSVDATAGAASAVTVSP